VGSVSRCGTAVALRPAWDGSPCHCWTEGFGCCEPTPPAGTRPHVGGVTLRFPPAVRRHAPPTFGCCGGAPAVEDL
jgi:hypothetical protein